MNIPVSLSSVFLRTTDGKSFSDCRDFPFQFRGNPFQMPYFLRFFAS